MCLVRQVGVEKRLRKDKSCIPRSSIGIEFMFLGVVFLDELSYHFVHRCASESRVHWL